jgi:hypothetical protein
MTTATAAKPSPTPFAQALAGNVAAGSKIVLTGRVDPSIPDSPSLIDRADNLGTVQCVALILDRVDLRRVRRNGGALVKVDGKAWFLADLARIFPDTLGEMNGRLWTGTVCHGELAVFVDRLSFETK